MDADKLKLHPDAWFTVKVWPPAVTTSVRAGPLLARTAKRILADPVPDRVLVDIDIQVELSDAVHAHPSVVSSSNSTCRPSFSTFALVGSSLNVQPVPWLTVKVRPAIVSEPDRDGPDVACASKLTVPFPLPLSPERINNHCALLDAVHAQPGGAVTATLPLPPAGGSDCVWGAMLNVQPCDCVTVTVCPATVNVPVRDGPVVAATSNCTLPFDDPDVDPWMAIQGAVVDAVHVHPLPAVTVTVPDPPFAPNACEVGTTTNAQAGGGGAGGVGPVGGGVGGGAEPVPGWVTVNTCPAMTSVPVRAATAAGATENVTDPDPVPVEP